MAEHLPTLKNILKKTYRHRFSFTPKTGIAFPKTGVLFSLRCKKKFRLRVSALYPLPSGNFNIKIRWGVS